MFPIISENDQNSSNKKNIVPNSKPIEVWSNFRSVKFVWSKSLAEVKDIEKEFYEKNEPNDGNSSWNKGAEFLNSCIFFEMAPVEEYWENEEGDSNSQINKN